ncbi:hypothetical protein ACVNS2_08205 [Paenibacillus caseinilyticus]|uniref:hypothetical protein n=1 Tax=Paenibacillus mucilaginosus TaxID=61624 RepID=UPI0002592BD7|nr:hypothetical protein [Paenibacillus mucilaginosus]
MKKLTLVLSAAFLLQLSTVSAAFAKDVLFNGEKLRAGESLKSQDGRFSLNMQTDGNLVIYQSGRAIWATGTDKVYIKYSDPFCWCERSARADTLNFNNRMYLTNETNPNVRGQVAWSSNNTDWVKNSGWYNTRPAPITTDGHYLVMQSDGNLVTYNSINQPVWASNTGGR